MLHSVYHEVKAKYLERMAPVHSVYLPFDCQEGYLYRLPHPLHKLIEVFLLFIKEGPKGAKRQLIALFIHAVIRTVHLNRIVGEMHAQITNPVIP